jgi:shikimate dehydrogenase
VSAAPGGESPDQYGVAGHPVAHSWSPLIHGMFAKATAQNMVYRLFDIPPKHFRHEVLQLMTIAGVRGLNVTVPHKRSAADLVNELTPRALRAGAVNTIACFDGASLLGDNTDGVGLVTDLERNLDVPLTGRRILILGAGGAVRGVLAPLLERAPAGLLIANRTVERAQALAAEFADLGAVSACGFDELAGMPHGGPFDLIINATSAGLQGKMPQLPEDIANAATVCYDMIYGRGPTAFTQWAKARQATRIFKGWGMLVEQAAESFMLWRGLRPDTQPVMQALAEHS